MYLVTFISCFQWWHNPFPGQAASVLKNPFGKEIFFSYPCLTKFEVIYSCTIACYLGEATESQLTTTSFEIVVENDKVPLSLLQAKRPQLPQSLFIRFMFQTLHCSSLGALRHLSVFLEVGGFSAFCLKSDIV